jgi:hypothetical protein
MVFDQYWYKNTYSDVEQSGMDPLFHFSKYGQVEGRYPNLGVVPNELLNGSTVQNQIKDLKNKIKDEALEKFAGNNLFSASRYQLIPKTLLLNPIYQINEEITSLLQEYEKIKINFYYKKNVLFHINKLRNIFETNIYIRIESEGNLVNKVEIEIKNKVINFKIEYPHNNLDTFMYQLYNMFIIWREKKHGKEKSIKFLNYINKNDVIFDKFLKIYNLPIQ